MNIYELTGFFPGQNGSGTQTAESHPGQYMAPSSSLTLGSAESGIFIPMADFKHGTENLASNSDQDVRYLLWNFCERMSDYVTVVQPEFSSVSVFEPPMDQVETDNGLLRRKQYNISFWFTPLPEVNLAQSLNFEIAKDHLDSEG